MRTASNQRGGRARAPRGPRLHHATLILLAACTPRTAPAPREAPAAYEPGPAAAVHGAPSPALSLRDLAAVFGVAADDAETASARTIDSYRQWTRRVLRQPEPYDVFMPVLLGVFVELPSDRTIGLVTLTTAETRDHRTFYYRGKPCPEAELERVRPWWSPATEVWVCHNDHRPEVIRDRDYSCDMLGPLPEGSPCGCGPNLMFCGTQEQKDATRQATRDELRLTLKHVIEQGRPFSEIITSNATVRPGLADLFTARAEFFVTGRFSPPDLQAPVTLRPRPELFKGGMLSTPLFLFGDSQRSMVASIWETFLCVSLRSQEVATKTILEKLRHETIPRESSLPQLAATVGCQNCHARLEYGQHFLVGWQSWLKGMHYEPSVAAATPRARFYVRDHHDLRAEVDANLGSLGALIRRQPEFARCMVSKMTNFIFEGTEVPYELERRLEARFARDERMDTVIEDAVIARAFGARDPEPRGPESRR